MIQRYTYLLGLLCEGLSSLGCSLYMTVFSHGLCLSRRCFFHPTSYCAGSTVPALVHLVSQILSPSPTPFIPPHVRCVPML